MQSSLRDSEDLAKPGQRGISLERGIQTPTHLTVAETAAQVGVSVRVIHLRIRAGLLPAIKLPGATSPYLIDAAVVEYMAIEEADRRERREARAQKRRVRADPSAAA